MAAGACPRDVGPAGAAEAGLGAFTRFQRADVPRMYRRVGAFWLSNRHRASPHLEARPEATTPRRPEMRTHGREGRLGRRLLLAAGLIIALVVPSVAFGGGAGFYPNCDPRCDRPIGSMEVKR